MLSSPRPAQGGHTCGCVRGAEGPHSWGTRGLGQSAVLILLRGAPGRPAPSQELLLRPGLPPVPSSPSTSNSQISPQDALACVPRAGLAPRVTQNPRPGLCCLQGTWR